MPKLPQHRMEVRAQLLADALLHREDLIVDMLESRPFKDGKTKTEALQWWSQHRYDQLGAQVFALLSPQDQLELDLALTEYNGVVHGLS